jgi:hypothetical protein
MKIHHLLGCTGVHSGNNLRTNTFVPVTNAKHEDSQNFGGYRIISIPIVEVKQRQPELAPSRTSDCATWWTQRRRGEHFICNSVQILTQIMERVSSLFHCRMVRRKAKHAQCDVCDRGTEYDGAMLKMSGKNRQVSDSQSHRTHKPQPPSTGWARFNI